MLPYATPDTTQKYNLLFCALLVAGSWVIANLDSLLHTLLLARLWFCTDNAIPHFCDVTPFLKFSCYDAHLNETMTLIEVGSIMITPLICILVSYILIAFAILRVPSTEGRLKAFSIWGSHLAVVFFHGAVIFLYFNLSSQW